MNCFFCRKTLFLVLIMVAVVGIQAAADTGTDLEGAKAALTDAEAAHAIAETALSDAQAALAEAQATQASAETAFANTQTAKADAETTLSYARVALADAEKAYTEAETTLTDAKTALAEAEAAHAGAGEAVASTETEADTATAGAITAEAEATLVESELAAAEPAAAEPETAATETAAAGPEPAATETASAEPEPATTETASAEPETATTETASASTEQEIPENIRNNEYFIESQRLLALAQESYDEGDYDAATEYSEEAARYAQLSDEYIARQTGAGDALPATYTVRAWDAAADCFWNIAGRPWVYNDPYKWRTLYEANKAKLAEPNNPNLIDPGIVLDIPAIKGETRRGEWVSGKTYTPLR
jgi:chromosome segregation ATPase